MCEIISDKSLMKYIYLLDDRFFFFNDTATTEIYTLSLHDALPISRSREIIDGEVNITTVVREYRRAFLLRSEEHTSELQSRLHLVCRLLLEKKKNGTFRNVGRMYVPIMIRSRRDTSDSANDLRLLH